MAQINSAPKKIEALTVKVKVRANDMGYYKGRIVNIGQEFIYEGGLNRSGGLPRWVDVIDENFKMPKAKAPAKKAAAPAPVVDADVDGEEEEEDLEEEGEPASLVPSLPPLAPAKPAAKGGKKTAKVSKK